MKLRSVKRAQRLSNLRSLVVLHDLAMVCVAWVVARMIVAYLTGSPGLVPRQLVLELNLILVCQGLVLWRMGLYRGLWRFASLPDLGNLLKAAFLGALACTGVLFLMEKPLEQIAPMAWLFPLLLLSLLGLPRLVYRMLTDMRQEVRRRRVTQRTLILGAGRSGRMLAPELQRRGGFDVVGFLDDNRALRGRHIHDVPVLGPVERLPKIVEEAAVDLAVIAMPSANNQQMQRVVEICEKAGIDFKTLPSLRELGSSATRLDDLKPVVIDDLLGRETISLDWNAIRTGLVGKKVLLTGGGGSIGSELCRQIARLNPERLVILDSSEYNLYRIDYQLRSEHSELLLESVLGNVCDSATIENVIAEHEPDVIFHAAAYKHLPMLQNQAREAFRNNVMGTMRVAEAAVRHQAETFVLISTDKAVNPSNVMGATKRVAELYCQHRNQVSDTRFITVRFGNVLNSTGSVVPLFNEQIRRGGPVTVTHPEISRYFMTISEASQLILQSAVLGKGGEVFVLDMGEPVRISYLAEQLIRLAGKEPGRDIEIVYTGLRPGEKLFEELFHDHENYAETAHDKILLARNGSRDLDWIVSRLRDAEVAVGRYDVAALNRILNELVPELRRSSGKPASVIPIGKAG